MRFLAALILIVSLLSIPFPIPAFGGQFEDAAAVMYRSDYETVKRILQPLAEQGNAEAQIKLGQMYRERGGLFEDHPGNLEAVKWYRKAAEQGNASGQNSLGYMYRMRGGGKIIDIATGKSVP